MPKRKYREGQIFMTQDKGNFVVLEHHPEKILLDSGKFKYRTKLLIKSELTGYKHWIMQTGLTRAELRRVDCDTFHVGNSRSFHIRKIIQKNATTYGIGKTIKNKNGVEFEILDRRYKIGESGKQNAWILVKSKETGYTRWRSVSKIKKKGGPMDTKTKIGKMKVINFNDPSSRDLPAKHVELWGGMLDRCYGNKMPKEKQKPGDSRVCQRWLNLYNFHIDIQKLPGYQEWLESDEPYHLDKDIKVKGNKVYNFKNCQFVPARINIMYTANVNGYTVECVKTGARYPSMAACARHNNVAYCTVKKHVRGKVRSPRWVRI